MSTNSFMMTITDQDGGNPTAVRATPSGVHGLAIHAAGPGGGWSMTHVPTGLAVAWWPDGEPEQLLACAQALGALGDWSTDDQSALPLKAAMGVVFSHGGSIKRREIGPQAWVSVEDGELVVTHYVGDDA